MGHSWARHGCLLRKTKEDPQQERCSVHTFLDGLPADGVTAMVIKECRLRSIASGSLWRSGGATETHARVEGVGLD